MKAQCTDPSCNIGAAVCKAHKPDNLSDKVKSWLARARIKYVAHLLQVDTTQAVWPTVSPDGVTAEVSAVRKMESWKSLPYDRRRLQTGKESIFLTDKELVRVLSAQS